MVVFYFVIKSRVIFYGAGRDHLAVQLAHAHEFRFNVRSRKLCDKMARRTFNSSEIVSISLLCEL